MLRPALNGQKEGPLRESNPGPPAPEAGIIPLDQAAAHRAGKHIFGVLLEEAEKGLRIIAKPTFERI